MSLFLARVLSSFHTYSTECERLARSGKCVTLGEGAMAYYFVLLAQNYQDRITVLVRSRESSGALMASIRQQVKDLDATLPIFGVRTIPQFLDRSLSTYQGGAVLLGTFAFVALLLAVVGIYGVLHFIVARRTREIGIRIALGAQRSQLARMVLERSLFYECLGAGMALAAARFTMLLLFGFVALIASAVPARRAIRVDPIEALRWEQPAI